MWPQLENFNLIEPINKDAYHELLERYSMYIYNPFGIHFVHTPISAPHKNKGEELC